MTNYNIIPTHLAVIAMRDNGYKNPAYAIAELMDNAIQAGATQVELLCGEEQVPLDYRTRSRIKQIAVLDNGCGMDASVLRMALQFGNGTYLDPDKHTGIGRFGMGLPNSSISQAKRVDVWTWKNGVKSAIHSYIDLDEIASETMVEVPTPQPKPLPNLWQKVSSNFGSSGTLVIWSDIDRCMWKTAGTIIKHSELLIGRIYRRFLADDRVTIKFTPFDLKQLKLIPNNGVVYAKPNDPLYLMKNTSCPQPDNLPAGEPMFQPWGEQNELFFVINFKGQKSEVKVRYSYAREEVREGFTPPPGARPYGLHAARNVGVSIVRAERELDLDPSWSNPSEPTDRWWGVEVEFPPALDELFGVTNNKQAARYFSDLAKVNLEDFLEPGQTLGGARDIFEADDDPRWPLLEIAHHIRKNVQTIRNLLDAQTKGSKRSDSDKRYDMKTTPEAKATEVTQKRKDEGHVGKSDSQENLPVEQKKAEITAELIEQGVMKSTAEELAATVDTIGYKYIFAEAPLDNPAFFNVKSRGGSIIISLNTSHPAYEHLLEVLEEDVNGISEETLKMRLVTAGKGLKLLLSAWARYEDEQPDGNRRTRVQESRWDWGRMARDFLDGEE